jgi:hypothetical protein
MLGIVSHKKMKAGIISHQKLFLIRLYINNEPVHSEKVLSALSRRPDDFICSGLLSRGGEGGRAAGRKRIASHRSIPRDDAYDTAQDARFLGKPI